MPNTPSEPTVRAAPERLLTLGEAAELLGVPDMQLGQAVRAGQLATAAAWRRGRLTRIVRAGDLAALDSAVLDRALPPMVDVELTTARTSPPALEEHKAPEVDPQPEPQSSDLADELDHLRLQVRYTREDNQRLLDQLTESGQEVEDLFTRLRGEEERYCAEFDRHRAAQANANRSLVLLRRAQWALTAVLLVVITVLVQTWPDGSVEAKSSPVEDILVAGLDVEPVVDAEPRDEDAAANILPEPEPEPQTGLEPETQTEPETETLQLPPAAPSDPPCTFYALTRPGSAMRTLLGPCSGSWSATHEAVAGVVRRGGVAYCRHHHFFATRLGGSIERAREVAALADREGLVPPLVDLRVDRAGAAFLRRRVGEWIESGFEAGLVGGEDHALVPAEGTDAWIVRSWVRYLDVGGVEHRRSFGMHLLLDDGPNGDRLLSFEWLDEPR